MGRVTIFSIDDCPFCRRAKNLLTKKGIEYYEINLDDYPQKRPDMLKAAKLLTVPQIFLNDHHVGGASELVALEEEGKLDEMWDKIKDEPEPTDPLLQRPDAPPAERPKPSERKDETIKAGETSLSLAQTVMMLENSVGKSFKGSTLVDTFVRKFKAERPAAVAIGKQLLEAGAISAAEKKGDGAFEDSSTWFMLSVLHRPANLNNLRQWTDRVDPPMLVVLSLKKQLGKVVSKHRDEQGLVDYLAVSKDEDFYAFEEAVCELQGIDFTTMDADTKLAFTINVYNTCITHAFAKIGAPKNALQRKNFFPAVGYTIGGHFYNLDDLESGILRGNRPSPGKFSGPIPKDDPRHKGILKPDEVDNRIHFALNCGAKSCPPVKKFTAEAVKEELDIVARAFFQQKENFSLSGSTIHLTKILSWYGKDFGKDKKAVATAVAQWLGDEDKKEVLRLVDTGSFSIKFNYYDWSNDAKTSKKVANACVIS